MVSIWPYCYLHTCILVLHILSIQFNSVNTGNFALNTVHDNFRYTLGIQSIINEFFYIFTGIGLPIIFPFWWITEYFTHTLAAQALKAMC